MESASWAQWAAKCWWGAAGVWMAVSPGAGRAGERPPLEHVLAAVEGQARRPEPAKAAGLIDFGPFSFGPLGFRIDTAEVRQMLSAAGGRASP